MRRFIVIEAEQRSTAWFAARAGRLTSSRAAEMLAKVAKGEAAGRRNLRAQLVLERITGKPKRDRFQSDAMGQGVDRERDALLMYEALTGNVLTPTGFLSHTAHMAGCSLDGHVGDFEGLVEAKSPIEATHLDYLSTGKVPGEYLKQIRHALWVTGAAWCDWLSYNPDFPEPLQVKLVRVTRDEADIADYEVEALRFLAEVDLEVAALKTKLNLAGTLREALAV